MEQKNGGGWKMIFLFKQMIFWFHVTWHILGDRLIPLAPLS